MGNLGTTDASGIVDRPSGLPEEVTIVIDLRNGPVHAVRQGDGRYVNCKGSASTCKYCAEFGSPQYKPDPYDIALEALLRHWDNPWNLIYQGTGEGGARTLKLFALDNGHPLQILDLGDTPELETSLGAIIDIHNRKLRESHVQ